MGAIVEQTTPSGYPANALKRRTTTNLFFPPPAGRLPVVVVIPVFLVANQGQDS
jgi:hypothetical protein